MIVALFVVVCLLDLVLPLALVLVCVHGFEQRSVVEWYVDLKARRRAHLRRLSGRSRRTVAY